jgi:uncharacterized membrane protein YeiH
LAAKHLAKFNQHIQFFDAIGLGAFTATGASLAPTEHLSVLMSIGLGVITGVGGGILRDVLAQRVPLVFKQEIYAIASVLGALVWYVGTLYLTGPIPLYLCFFATLTIRLFAMHYNLNLPKVGCKAEADLLERAQDAAENT